MFQIGEFSRIARVTIETLRHYDAIGLLKPTKVDPQTGYRYYKAQQLHTLHHIMALKEVGLSLEEIMLILKEKQSVDEIRQMLKTQLVTAEQTIKEAQHRQQLILNRLQSLEAEAMMPKHEVSLKSVEAFTVVSIREKIPTAEQIPQRWNELFTVIANWLKKHHLPAGIPLALYHNESYTIENIDTECAFILPNLKNDQLPQPPAPLVIRQMEALPSVATTVVTNFPIQVRALETAYTAMGQWVANHGYHLMAAPRELYYGSPETGDFTVEIQFPVVKLNS